MAFPRKDSLLVPYSTNWDTRITATPTVFALTAAQALAYKAAHDPYVAAAATMAEAAAAGSRSKSLTTTRDQARANLLHYGRQLYAIVQASASVSDANKDLLGVTPKPTTQGSIPPPSATPTIDILERFGSTVRIRVRNEAAVGRAKPAGVQGISVFSHVGPTPPADLSAWVFQGNISKPAMDVQFAATLPPGTVVWLTAFFYNPRGQSGTGCTPVSAILAGGGMQQAA
jgi:hypothetical protein